MLLEFDVGDYGLYVGSTGRTPDERFVNHKAGRKASKWVKRFGIGLLPALYRHLNPLEWAAAVAAEAELAQALRTTGWRVHQG